MGQHPTSVTRATQLLLGLLVAGLVVTVLVVVFRDDLEEAWSAGHPADSAIQPLDFVPVAIVLYVVVALLMLSLIPFFRNGANWARHSLAAMVLVIVLATVAGAEDRSAHAVRGAEHRLAGARRARAALPLAPRDLPLHARRGSVRRSVTLGRGRPAAPVSKP